jgi:HSP20 family molecular chaperone IbpA
MNNIVPLLGALFILLLTLPIQAQPFSYTGPAAPYHRPPMASSSSFHTQRAVRFKQDRDDKGYHLKIITRGYTPEAIQVRVDGPFLVVENREAHRVENRHERGYSFSSSSSSMRRRFRLPRNADGARMQRAEEDGVIVITLPYR